MDFSRLYFFFKRSFDLVFSLCTLIVLAPLFFVLAVAIKCDSKGPVLYKDTRVGLNGKLIAVYKFRTMHLHADKKLASLLAERPELKAEWDRYQKIKCDPRCTPLGKRLRQLSLDELPQFFCVLKGDLSIVGPRPYSLLQMQSDQDGFLQHRAATLLSVKPGITGIWQVSGRSYLPYQTRIALDCSYIEKKSFSYDLLLVLKTVPQLFVSKGAF